MTALIEDREGNIWAATLDGFNRLTPHKMTPITDLGLVSAVDGDGDGRSGSGSVDSVVPFADGLITCHGRADPARPIRRSRRCTPTTAGALWVATAASCCASPAIQAHDRLARRGALNQITDITSDGDGGCWLHDAEPGLQRWSTGRLTPAPLPHEFKPTALLASYTDREGRAWSRLREPARRGDRAVRVDVRVSRPRTTA